MRNLRGESFIRRVCHEDDDEKRYLKRRKIVPDFRTPLVKVYVVKKPVVASRVGDDSSSSGLYICWAKTMGVMTATLGA
jgi:hypothetical protein